MKQVILTMQNCQKCEMLKKMKPNAEYVELGQSVLLAFARAAGVASMPMVVTVGEPQELSEIVK